MVQDVCQLPADREPSPSGPPQLSPSIVMPPAAGVFDDQVWSALRRAQASVSQEILGRYQR
jgi:hypothetical protein